MQPCYHPKIYRVFRTAFTVRKRKPHSLDVFIANALYTAFSDAFMSMMDV